MKNRLLIITILIISILFGACDKKNNNNKLGEGSVDIYYVNTKTSGLVTESYDIISTKTEEQINELLYMLKMVPKNMVYKSALPEVVKIQDFLLDDNGSLTINFDTTYNELTGIPEVLCRAAIVKTLSQISKVEYIQFNVNGQPLMDSNGNVVGLLTKDDFIDDTGADTYYKVTLYYANDDGNALIENITDINYTGTGTIEELVIKQLINGPTDIGMYSTIPEGTILLNASKEKGLCTVDLNEKFLDPLPEVNAEITIYSIVNTLVELPDINKVQFKINGQVKKTFREDMPFDVVFERNLELLDSSN